MGGIVEAGGLGLVLWVGGTAAVIMSGTRTRGGRVENYESAVGWGMGEAGDTAKVT